ncbi:hypothetical protein BOM24_01465 [Tatumella sp. OPLPL6]|nr:hypothetical protein BOM24_01465 [Tatumella sp. OPLPL6]
MTTRHYYDAAGRARAQTFAHDHPQAITHYYQRDPLGRLTSRITPDNQTRFHYTANGLLANVSRYLAQTDDDQPDDSLTFSYDKLGRRIGEQHQTLQCPTTQLAWQYDALGNCTVLTLPDGRQIRQHYYGSGHLLSLAIDKRVVSEFTRDALHREISRSQGALTQYDQYDRLGRLTDRQVFSGEHRSPLAPRFARRWQYDFSNNLVSETRQGNLFDHTLWHYDRSGHLLSQTDQQMGNEQWHYDAASNPLTHADSPPIVDNRVTELKGLRWEYDIHGRTILKQTADYRYHYRYNSEHQLIEVRSEPKLKHQDTTVTTYRYDGLGRRISKSTAIAPDPFTPNTRLDEPKVTRFVWEGLRLLQEIPEYGLSEEKLYLYSDSGSYEPLARLDDNHQLYWYHTTPNGTPERLTDEAGEVRWQGVNNTWGKQVYQPMLTGGRVEQNLRMQGQYYDEESGLHYNLFRYYDPDSGRFTQLDPIGLAGGINLYQYAPNALGWLDPLGLSRCSLGEETGRYSAIKPGPLDKNLAETFSGGKYREIILSQDTSFYRAGVSTNPFGRFFSLERPQSIIQVRVDKAVLPKWPNGSASPLDSVYEIKIPAGTKVYIGEVGYQSGFYLGGTERILILEPWNVGTVIGKWPLL